MNKKKIIILVIVFVVILIAVIAFIMYRKRKQDEADAAAKLAELQAKLNDPNTPDSRKASILANIQTLISAFGNLRSNAASAGSATGGGGTGIGSDSVRNIQWLGGGVGICSNASPLDATVVISKGSRSPEVCMLQKTLNAKGARLVVDGDFGTLTEQAAIKYTGKSGGTLAQLSKVL